MYIMIHGHSIHARRCISGATMNNALRRVQEVGMAVGGRATEGALCR